MSTLAPPYISVVIPAYNAETFLAEAVESVRAQTLQPLELIIVDDGSRDGTPALIARLAEENVARGLFPICGIFQKNAGPSAARNRGLAEAQGRYLAFLDADDRWFPDKLAKQLEVLEADPSIGLCSGGWRIITESGMTTLRTGGAPEGELTFESLLHLNLIGTPSTVLGRTALFRKAGGFDRTLRYAEDLEFWLRLTLLPEGKIWNLGRPVIERRERAGQLTRDWSPMREGWLEVLRRVQALAPERVRPLARAARAMNDRYIAFLAYEAGDFKATRRLTAAAWSQAPMTLLGSRHAYFTTLAALTSILPRPLHQAIDRRVRRWREGSHPA